MAAIRLDNEERRKAIVEAAMPLFARKGFAGTTTKEIAEAARVSEALVFKHFPSKAALYEEILHLGCLGDPSLECVNELPPSTASLVQMMRYMVRHFVFDAQEMDASHRLMINSFLEDGEYARLVTDTVMARIYPKFAELLAAAQRAGDLAAAPPTPENAFWFAQHVAAMLAYARLPKDGTVPYRGDAETIVAEAAAFILRGLGIKETVLERHLAAASRGNNGAFNSGERSRA